MFKVGDKVKLRHGQGSMFLREYDTGYITYIMNSTTYQYCVVKDETLIGTAPWNLKVREFMLFNESELELVNSSNNLEIIVDENGTVRVFKDGNELNGVTEVSFTAKVDEAPELYVRGFVL